jgi:protein TonB
MDRRPVIIAIVLSLILHYAVGQGAMLVKGDPPGKRRKIVAVVGAEKKKEEPKKPPPPPPPPPPKAIKAAPKPAPVEAPKAAPPPEPVHEVHAAPVATGLEMSNTGPGIDVGGPEVKGPKPGQSTDALPVKKPTAVKKPDAEKAADAHDQGEGPAPCTEDATKPEPIQKTDIEYTEEARAAGVEGRLVLKVTIDENGAVTDVAVASSVDPSLDAAAIAAVKQWRFKPSTKCGKPVAGTYTLARRFELGD